MSTDFTALFPNEVITMALARDIALPGGAGTFVLITLDNGFDHTKPNTFGPATLSGLSGVLSTLRARAQAGEIVGVGVTGKPFIFAVGADLTGIPKVTTARAGAGHRPARAPDVRAAPDAPGADLRVRQRRGHGWRRRDRAQRGLPEHLCRGARGRAARVLPGSHARLGRLLHAAEPHRRRAGPEGHHREPAEHQPHAQGTAGLRARDRRRHVRAGHLPGGLPVVGGRRDHRQDRGDPSRGRPRCDALGGCHHRGKADWSGPRPVALRPHRCALSSSYPRPAPPPAKRPTPPRTTPRRTC